jgi:drug/metabolite transporter (DMT)-like permease
MKLIIKLFGILLIFAGVVILIKPEIIFGLIEHNLGSSSLYITAIAVRLIMGVLLVLSAGDSKYPGFIKILGYLFILAAVVFIFIGQVSFQEFITTLIPYVNPYAAISGLLSMAFGAFLFYAFSRK